MQNKRGQDDQTNVVWLYSWDASASFWLSGSILIVWLKTDTRAGVDSSVVQDPGFDPRRLRRQPQKTYSTDKYCSQNIISRHKSWWEENTVYWLRMHCIIFWVLTNTLWTVWFWNSVCLFPLDTCRVFASSPGLFCSSARTNLSSVIIDAAWSQECQCEERKTQCFVNAASFRRSWGLKWWGKPVTTDLYFQPSFFF